MQKFIVGMSVMDTLSNSQIREIILASNSFISIVVFMFIIALVLGLIIAFVSVAIVIKIDKRQNNKESIHVN